MEYRIEGIRQIQVNPQVELLRKIMFLSTDRAQQKRLSKYRLRYPKMVKKISLKIY